MGFERVVDSFAGNAVPGGFNLVEGNRGLYDGADARGTHSTAEVFPIGTRLRGHEFHYSRMVLDGRTPSTACAVHRGTGCFSGRDAVVTANVWAAYTHLHALGTPQWAHAILSAARSAHVVV